MAHSPPAFFSASSLSLVFYFPAEWLVPGKMYSVLLLCCFGWLVYTKDLNLPGSPFTKTGAQAHLPNVIQSTR